MDFKDLELQDLQNLQSEKRDAFNGLVALENPTADQVDEAEVLADELDQIKAEITRRESAPDRMASLRSRFAEDAEETSEEETEEETEEEGAEEGEPTETEARSNVQRLSGKTKRPQAPATSERGTISLTAAADVPGFAASSKIDDMLKLSEAIIARASGFAPPQGDGSREDWHKFGVASLHLPFEDDLIIDRHTADHMAVLEAASDESRLEGGSLVAAGGWCSPSETLYDLTGDETTEGLISLPEVGVRRGGIRYTFGPDFSDFYANSGFIQTEAQAIAGNTKPCVEIPCPDFTEVRLDAVGLCLRINLLQQAGYPELVQRYTSGTLVAHQHMVNADVINRLVTVAGTPRVITGMGSTAHDLLTALELIANQRRQSQRMSLNRTLEVVAPFWLKAAIRADLGIRNGQATEEVSDAQIDAHFRARNLNVQWVYDWQSLPTADVADDPNTTTVDETVDADVYPSAVDVLMYPAGTFVKGTKDVINLSAVYDAASLSTNTYTGLFVEEGLLVAHMKHTPDLVRVPICNAGRTGAADLTCA